MNGCLFCRIIAGEIPATKVYEDELVVAIEDIAPVAPVHLLLLPKRHHANLLELTESDDQTIGHLHRVAASLAKSRGIAAGGFRLVVNTNGDAGQSVFHTHFHLMGGRNLTWPPG